MQLENDPTVRQIAKEELALVASVLSRAMPNIAVPPAGTLVRVLEDGGMGSLSFDLAGDRKFGAFVGEETFVDRDGVSVLASVYLDLEGNLFELDIFKADFAPVQRLPMGEL